MLFCTSLRTTQMDTITLPFGREAAITRIAEEARAAGSSLQILFSTKDAVTPDLNHRVPEIVGRMTLKQGKMRRQC